MCGSLTPPKPTSECIDASGRGVAKYSRNSRSTERGGSALLLEGASVCMWPLLGPFMSWYTRPLRGPSMSWCMSCCVVWPLRGPPTSDCMFRITSCCMWPLWGPPMSSCVAYTRPLLGPSMSWLMSCCIVWPLRGPPMSDCMFRITSCCMWPLWGPPMSSCVAS
jgi:hypothetical protein